MKIGGRRIGAGEPVYVIAELGVNHDGSVERALELTRAAADAGADAVKLQCFDADLLLSRASRPAGYQSAAGEHDPAAMLRRLQLSIDQLAVIVERAHALGMHAIVTVFSVPLVAPAARLPWDAFKVASPDIIHRPLLEALAATGRPLIVSTGAAEVGEVTRALSWLHGARERLALMQCVSAYPTPQHRAELGGIGALASIFDGPVGYSDHTTDIDTGGLASAAGATLLEKHLTHDRAARGPDHAASLDPHGLARYIALARDPARFAGDDLLMQPRIKRVLPEELDVRTLSRQSIVAARSLPAGHRLSADELAIKRPGSGIEPWRLDSIVGRRLARPVDADLPLCERDLEAGAAEAA
jgi:N-acetylneuraminate synthase/N,N'-diacetyllegionaminate synthase